MSKKIIIFWTSIFLSLFLSSVKLEAIILHPDGEPDLITWTDRPDVNVVGRWSSNASFVVVAPNWVVTTRHQNTSPSTVRIDGVSYVCNYKSEWTGGPAGNADIRLIKLTKSDGNNPNLAHYASPYKNSDEVEKNIVIGGFGQGRGALLSTFYEGQYVTYGYQWDGSANTILRWGQNRIDGIDVSGGIYLSDVIEADFDGLGDVNSTDYECIIALYDSGAGWFIYDDGEWKVAGLSRGVEHAYESWFRNNLLPQTLDPDVFDAVRISSYAQWIEQIIYPESAPIACIIVYEQTVEAEGVWGAKVTLDGSCSSDADSTLGTNDDINDFNWFEIDPCNPDNDIFLGSGQILDCNLPLGLHTIVLEVTDKAGATDSNEINITIKDTTSPEVIITEPASGQYAHSATVTLNYSASDSGSGVKSVTAKMDGSTTLAGHGLASGQAINLLTELSLGQHTFTVEAVDNIGNSTTQSVTLSVAVTDQNIKDDVSEFIATGKITDKYWSKSLFNKLDAAAVAWASGDCTTASSIYQTFINELRAQSGKKVNPTAAQILITDATYLMTHCP